MRKLLTLVFLAGACGTPAKPSTDPTTPPPPPQGANGNCIKTGCSGTIFTEPGYDMMTTCEMKPEYACYQTAECKAQADGKCGWTMTDELESCLASPPPLQ